MKRFVAMMMALLFSLMLYKGCDDKYKNQDASYYAKRLQNWASAYKYDITLEDAKELINLPSPVNDDQGFKLVDESHPIWQLIRDVEFIEGMQRDISEWENKHLPSEAQWEKAARGSADTRLYPWGAANASCAIANFRPGGSPEFCVGDTSQVGTYVAGASPYGVMDMAGNAFEWVMDWYRADYYKDSPYENPPGPTGGSGERVLRGGAWNYSGWHMRAAYRVKTNPDDGYYENGFRCARPPME